MKDIEIQYNEIFKGYKFTLVLDNNYDTTLELRQLLFYIEESIISLLSQDNILNYYGWARISKIKNSGIRLLIKALSKKNPSELEFVIVSIGFVIINYSSIKEFFTDLKRVLTSRINKGRAEIGGTIKLKVKKGTDVIITENDEDMEIEIKVPLRVTLHGPPIMIESQNKLIENKRNRLPLKNE